jgi:type VII secretion-associated serine protease mycosin
MFGKRAWALLATVALGAALTTVTAGPAAADECGDDAAQPGGPLQTVPWQQKVFDPERIWPFATGAGQTVAVVDTGVDGNRSQLTGHVLAGFDMQTNKAGTMVDCSSHGTAVASLIAAQPDDTVGYQGVPFHGVAKGAAILPVRMSNVDPADDPHGAKQPNGDMIAQGITWAANHGATVIDVSTVTDQPNDAIQAAVQKALNAGIVVVAAAGDEHDPNHQPDPMSYPAAYDGVIGVGSIDQTFARSDKSDVGTYVDVVAPGDSVPAATRQSGYESFTGTSIAAAFVAATAALVRQVYPQLTPAEVAQRIISTADPAPGGQQGQAYGHGVVDPYRAVTEKVMDGQPMGIAGASRPSPKAAAMARERWWGWTSSIALVAAGIAGFVLIILVSLAVVLPRGRRRRWLPARAPRPVTPPEDPVGDADDAKLFAVPQPFPRHSDTDPVDA